MDDSKSPPDQKSAAKKRPQGGVGTPFAGESSGSNIPVPPQDEATLVDAFPKAIDPDATLVDTDATIAPGTSFRRTPTPALNRISKFAKPLPQDEATLVDAFPKAIDPEATLVDADATIALGTPFRRTPPPTPKRVSDPYASAAVLQIGAVLGGRYEILQLLGEGGMGAVYKAADRELDRFVALKVIRPELASNPSILARFKQELLLAHQVTHRNVIRIYDLGEAEGVKFITMEFIEGQDLRALIREKEKFTPEEAVDVIQQVCQALNAAHSVGVIHRDLKPQNIMQDASGRILVMDFGLARTLEGDGMTQTGAIVGTMEYMSPEQALAKDLDQRSDIFALGLILYEMLTGKQPFAAESALASLIKRTQERATPVSDIDAQIPGALSGIVSKCLERDLEQRYQNVSTILADLNTWQDKRAAGTIKLDASVKPWGQTLPWPRITAIVTVLVLAISGYMLRDRLFRSSPSTSPSTDLLLGRPQCRWRYCLSEMRPEIRLWIGSAPASPTCSAPMLANPRSCAPSPQTAFIRSFPICASLPELLSIPTWLAALPSSVMPIRWFGDNMRDSAARYASTPQCTISSMTTASPSKSRELMKRISPAQ